MIPLLILNLYMHHANFNTTQYTLGAIDGSPVILEVGSLGGTDISGHPLLLEKRAAEAFARMSTAALNDGLNLSLSYAHRSMIQQVYLFKKNRRLAGPPGRSAHQQGMAIDVRGCTTKIGKRRYGTEIFKWLKTHAASYGFYNTISYEPWHWEYVPAVEK